jgi:hypothetical protein
MSNYVSITQVGDKSDRVHRIGAQSKETDKSKVFTVKGVGNCFVIFEGDQQLASFKTLTKCKEYISGVTLS